jgi:hypothetical protein
MQGNIVPRDFQGEDRFDDAPAPTQPLKLFPIIAGTKTPALSGDWRKHATSDPTQIEAWRAAGYNLGCDCEASGLAVIDLDGGEIGEASWAKLQGEHGIAPATREHRTPRGGRHLIYRGSILSSVQKLGPKLDTRGVGGYIVWEGSTEDGSYSAIRDVEPTTVPVWIAPTLGASKSEHKAAVEDLDLPVNLRRAERFLKGLQPVVQGDGADARTYEVAAKLRDLGVSAEASVDLMLSHYDCTPQDDRFEAFIARKVENVWSYAQNEPGAWGVDGDPVDRFADYVSPGQDGAANDDGAAPGQDGAANDPDVELARRLLPAYSPLQGSTRPPLEFWDEGKLLPKGGSAGRVGLLVAPSHDGKSTIETTLGLAACLDRQARILFCAGEGADDIMGQQLPAACAARGVTLEALDATGRWLTVEGVPLMSNEALVRGFVKLYRGHHPDIVIIDTLAAAMAGLNEDSAETGAMLTSNGPVGVIARAFKATVLLAHHTGKDVTKGGRGSSAFHGNSDFFLLLTANKVARVSSVFVDKMRGGRSRYSQAFSVDEGLNGVGVARRIDAKEAAQRRGRITPGMKARSEVGSALISLADAGQVGTVSVPMLVTEIFSHREAARVSEAEDAGDTYVRPTAAREAEELNSIRTNLIYKFARTPKAKEGEDQEPAALEIYVAKDRNGDRLDPLQFRLPDVGEAAAIDLGDDQNG